METRGHRLVPRECSSRITLIGRIGPESLLGSEVVAECHDLQVQLDVSWS